MNIRCEVTAGEVVISKEDLNALGRGYAFDFGAESQ